MRLAVVCILGLAGLAGSAARGTAADPHMLRQSHAWARFAPGSWRQVQIVTQSFDAQGNPTDSSVTDNKTTIEAITPERVTLKVEVTVEVAGQRFGSEPQVVHQGYAGETVGDTVSVTPLAGETVLIDGEQVYCEQEQIEIIGGVTREVSQISYSPQHWPAILKRKRTMQDAAGVKTMQEATSEVKSVDMPRRLLNERDPKSAFLVREVQSNDRGLTTTWSWHVPEVPGEIVDQCSRKVDTEGRLVRRTTLELVGYGVTGIDDDGSSRDPAGRRARRARRR